MALPKELTTVTKTSKLLALVLFIALPFLGFYLGMTYEGIRYTTYKSSGDNQQKTNTTKGEFTINKGATDSSAPNKN